MYVLEDESDAVGADYKHDQVPETFRASGSSGMNLFSLTSRTPSSHRSVFMSKLAVRLWCETNLSHYLSLRRHKRTVMRVMLWQVASHHQLLLNLGTLWKRRTRRQANSRNRRVVSDEHSDSVC